MSLHHHLAYDPSPTTHIGLASKYGLVHVETRRIEAFTTLFTFSDPRSPNTPSNANPTCVAPLHRRALRVCVAVGLALWSDGTRRRCHPGESKTGKGLLANGARASGRQPKIPLRGACLTIRRMMAGLAKPKQAGLDLASAFDSLMSF